MAGDFLFGLAFKGQSTEDGFQLVGPYAKWVGSGAFPLMAGDLTEPIAAVPGDRASFPDSMAAHPRYHGYVRTSPEASKPAYGEYYWRRLSKGALYWATHCTDRHVHFLLDDLKMEAVVNKNTMGRVMGRPRPLDQPFGKADPDLPQSKKKRAITGAELRWVYRHRALPVVRERIQFWYEGIPSLPPWERGDLGWAQLWQSYVPTSTAG